MSNDTKYEYSVAFLEDFSGGYVAAQTQKNIVYMAERGWELFQLNPNVVSVDNGAGSLMAQYSATITYRRPIQQDG